MYLLLQSCIKVPPVQIFRGGVCFIAFVQKVGNLIRGVAKANPAGPIYHEASNAMFGEINSYTGYQLNGQSVQRNQFPATA